ncbi:hypothetical protein [Pseudomonas fluorescens]|uniref:hypothetical protein n=1 Tax=Pseudomonas fluorescens TaxID=294 RepID=UPI001BE4ED73|nr:hypothetical protein [Pseudomonas fluorescens]MBT2375514.1 hypothetical protein [Pseudomonas fluorescens]
MAVRQSGATGDVVARELKESIAKQVKARTGFDLPSTQSIDQMIRAAARHGIRFSLVSYMGNH